MVTWVLESGVFPNSHTSLRDAIRDAGHSLVDWLDSWQSEKPPKRLSNGPTVFHGSLGNAAYVNDQLDWTPGSFCDADRFRCSYWYDIKRHWLIHERYVFTTVAELVENAPTIAENVGATNALFVRPDSPLKPFSGRVVNVSGLTPKHLDYGFYYEDLNLPIVVAPVRRIGREWRFVVVNGEVISGSGYDPTTRTSAAHRLDDSVFQFAAAIAAETFAPYNVYIMDVCDCDNDLRLVEFNPFGGADLYACDPSPIVESISQLAVRWKPTG